MLFAYRIKRDFKETNKQFLENVKLKEFVVDVLVETSPYLDRSSQDSRVYFKMPDKTEFLANDVFLTNIGVKNLNNADNIGNYFSIMKFLLEIERKIVPSLLEFKDLYNKFRTYKDNIYADEEINKLVNLAFITEANKRLSYNYIQEEYQVDNETYAKEIPYPDYLKDTHKYVSIYDIEVVENKAKFYLTNNYDMVYIVEKIIIDKEINDLFKLIGKSFSLETISKFIKNENMKYGKFRFTYNTIDECKQNFIRQIAKDKNKWVLFSGKEIKLPSIVKYEPTILASVTTNDSGSYVGVKDIFALANKIKMPNSALEEFKKFLEISR